MRRPLAAALAFGFAFALHAEGEKYELRRPATVGDRLRVARMESKVDDATQTLTMTVEGRKETRTSSQHERVTVRMEFGDEVQGTEGDRTMRVRRTFAKVEVKAERKPVEAGKEVEPRDSDRPEEALRGLEGKTLDLVRVAGITGVGGKDAQGMSAALKDSLEIDLDHVHLLPDRPVSVGESWAVTGPALRRLLTPGSSGRMLTDMAGALDAKLDAIEAVDGRRRARVRFAGTLKFAYDPARGEGGGEAAGASGRVIPGGMEVAGELTVGLDGPRETKLAMKLQIAILGDVSPDAETSLLLDVKAGIELEETAVWEARKD